MCYDLLTRAGRKAAFALLLGLLLVLFAIDGLLVRLGISEPSRHRMATGAYNREGSQ